jgi:hypothetical protein
MTGRASLVAFAVVTAVNAAVLLGVVRDRPGGPESQIWLDERELAVQLSSDNSAVTLRWRPQQTVRRGTELVAASQPWLDPEALTALGFDCSVRPGDPRARAFYDRQLSRRVFVALELSSAHWNGRLAWWQERARERLERSTDVLNASARMTLQATIDDVAARASRLVPVDAGLELDLLRTKYPDPRRHLVVPAVVAVVYYPGDNGGGPSVGGRLVEVLPASIQVPRHARAAFIGLEEDPAGLRNRRFYGGDVLAGLTLLEHRPRYRVRVSLSAQGRPRVEEAQRLP